MDYNIYRLAPAVALCLPLLATAQGGRAEPADASSPASALQYESAFSDYKPWQDIKPADWRAVNDNVRGTAGKSDAGKRAGQAMPASASPAASVPETKGYAPVMPNHGGHQMHGGKP